MKLNNINFEYFRHSYNETWTNERYIEVPIGIYFLNKFKLNCIEIGAVMPYYGYLSKIIIDPYDSFDGCLRINALDYSYISENVLSISTIEHFKIDERNRTDKDSIFMLNKIIQEASNYLITWPVGYNLILDNYVEQSDIKYKILRRINYDNEWEIVNDSKKLNYIYNKPTNNIKSGFPFANAIVIVTNLEEFN